MIKTEDLMKPRALSEEEIQNILSVIPDIKSGARSTSQSIRESMLKTIREQLREIVLSPLAIDDIKEEIYRQFAESVVKAGTVVGVTAAEAFGGPITQMALNSFHTSGSSKNVSYGIDRMTELLNASQNPKNTSVTIHFKNDMLTFDDVLIKMRPSFTDISVKDTVKGIPDIEDATSISYDEPWWYNSYKLIIGKKYKASHYLRLTLDVNFLYSYKITMEDIVKIIETDQPVVCVYSPMNVGIIDIYPIEKLISGKLKDVGPVSKEVAPMIFLETIVIPALDKLKIKGVPGIKRIYPVEATVLQIVKDEQKVPSMDNAWFMIVNPIKIKTTGIKINKLVILCQAADIEVLGIKDKYIIVKTKTGESPSKIITQKIKLDREEEKEYESNKRKEGSAIIRRPPTEISKAEKIIYADSDGSTYTNSISTLRKLLSRIDVDSTHTYSNNMHEINKVLGIEAARSFLIKEFTDVISYEGSYINPRHIVLLVDFMTSLGKVYGITFSGVSRQNKGVLEKASFEQAMDTFKYGAAFGEKQNLDAVSASLYVGKVPTIGTGFSDTFMDISKYKELEEQINIDKTLTLDINSFDDAIDQIEDMTSGVDVTFLEGLEDEMFAGDPIIPPARISAETIPVDPRFLEMTAGKTIRAPELIKAASILGNAPCLLPPEPKTIVVTEMKSPVRTLGLPFATPGTTGAPTLGLPSLLTTIGIKPVELPAVEEIVEFPTEETFEPVGFEFPEITEGEKAVQSEMLFDLADFLGMT